MAKHVLLTGSTGFMGIHLVRALLEQGYEITELVRPQSRHPLELEILGSLADSPKRHRIEMADFSYDTLTARLKGSHFDGCFHLAGLVSYLRADQSKMYDTHVKLTDVMLSVAQNLKIPRFIQVSSIVAIGHLDSSSASPLTETSEYNSQKLGLAYWETKLESEKRALASNRGDFSVVVVNPGSMLGVGERTGQLTPFLRSLAVRPFAVLPAGGSDFVDIRDAVQGTIAAFERGRSGERYILGGENVSYLELYRRLRSLTSGSKSVAIAFVMPRSVLRFAEYVFKFIERVFGIDLPINSAKLRRVNGVYMFNSSQKAQRELNYHSRSIDEALIAMTKK